MSTIKDFADQLQQEVVSDMAESYFGARKDLENMISAFGSMASEFKEITLRLSQAAAAMHALLLDRQTARDFYISLDILPSCIPFPEDIPLPDFGDIPFAFTLCGRYTRYVSAAYARLQALSDEYLNGRYYDDPEQPGRKRLTVHYLRLKALAEHINSEVARVNTDMSTTGILRHVKGMDPEKMKKEHMLGDVCLMEGCKLDTDMYFTPIDFEALGLPVVQDLPSLEKIREPIRDFCRGICSSRKEDVGNVLNTLRAS